VCTGAPVARYSVGLGFHRAGRCWPAISARTRVNEPGLTLAGSVPTQGCWPIKFKFGIEGRGHWTARLAHPPGRSMAPFPRQVGAGAGSSQALLVGLRLRGPCCRLGTDSDATSGELPKGPGRSHLLPRHVTVQVSHALLAVSA
jgi:hypothetical protein